MSLSARTPTTASTYYFVPTIYSKKVEEATKKDLVAWDAINSSWESELVKGNVLDIPKSNVVTASEVVVGTKGSALNPLNTAGVQLTIDQWYQAPIDIDYMTLKQTQANVEGVASTESAYAIRVQMDTSVCALFSSLGGYSTSAYGTDGQTLSDDILLYLKETLDESDVPQNNRSLILDPSGLVDMLKIDKLVSADYIRQGGNIENGKIGNSVYGCMVRVTNNLAAASTGSYGAMLHKNAIAGAAQIQNAWVKEFQELHQRRYHSEALWGVIEVNDAFGIPFFTRKA
jgi:hypothetical protein